MKRTGCVLVVLMALASVGCARGDWISETLTLVDVSGTWEGTGVLRNGEERSLRLVLRQRGSKVAGEIEGIGRFRSAIDGVVNGESFSLTFQGTQTRYKGDATISGDEMHGKVDGGGCPCTMVLRRLGSDR